jgi:hypothetical protein
MQGLSEVITLMLALGGFGVDENKKAPKADAVLEYAVDEADLVAHLDVVAVAPRNYKVLVGLPDHPSVAGVPEVHKLATQIKANLEGVRGMAQNVAGIDLVDDVSSITLFVDVTPDGGMQRMVVARGSFPKDLVTKIADLAGTSTGEIDGRKTVEVDPTVFVGTAADGALIAGPKAWVEARVDDDWKPAKRKKGSAWAAIAKRLDARPWALIASKVDEDSAKALAAQLGGGFVGDLVTSHQLAILSLHHDGVALHWQDRSKDGLDRIELATEGVVELMRAAHLAPRGAVKLVAAAIGSYAGQSQQLDALIAQKGDLVKLIDDLSGDGKFKVDVDRDDKKRTFDLRAKGKELSDVVPVATLVPLGVGVLLLASAEEEREQRAQEEEEERRREERRRQREKAGREPIKGGVGKPPATKKTPKKKDEKKDEKKK